MTSNLLGGATNAAAFVDLVRESDVDVLMVQELSVWQAYELVGRRDRRAAAAPRAARVAVAAGGSGIYSRYPLDDVTTWPEFFAAQVQARLDLPGDVADPLVVSVHPTTVLARDNAPGCANRPRCASGSTPLTGPVVVAGDFNATYDHKAFRRYLGRRLHRRGRGHGSGLLRTWPARHPLFPVPFAGIDHVLTRGGPTPESARSIRVRNSDHLGVIARVSGAG